jgi:peroxiredoxin
LAALEADREQFEALDADIFAVNPASVKAHDKYCDNKGYTYPILSDSEKTVARQYEALKLGGLLIERTVYVVGPDGHIIYAQQGIPPDQEMLDAIRQDKNRRDS